MLTVHREYDVPAPQLWKLLVSPSEWPSWGPTIRRAEAKTPLTLGTKGRVQTALGVWLPFEITEFDPGRYWRWKVAGIPATGHRVEARGHDHSRVTFEVPLFAAPYLLVCELALQNLDRNCLSRRRHEHAHRAVRST